MAASWDSVSSCSQGPGTVMVKRLLRTGQEQKLGQRFAGVAVAITVQAVDIPCPVGYTVVEIDLRGRGFYCGKFIG